MFAMPSFEPAGTTVVTARPALARRLALPLVVLFGLGVTIGAGIYVLVGATAGRAGMHAPLAFLLAALVMAPTAASFAELAGRMPVSAGEATYVRLGLGSERLGLIVGLLVVTVGIISAAAISQGSAGYIRALFPIIPWALVIPLVVLLTGLVTAWGILESMAVAGVMTLIEIGGLLVIIIVGVRHSPDVITRLPEMWHGLSAMGALSGMLSAMLLAFFAFIGFEGLANIAEEVKEPERTLPRAIFITLVLSTLLYVAVTWIAIVAVPRAELAASRAPLSLVFERVTGASPMAISAISTVATVNGIIAQMVMASRVLYGLAEQGLLPTALARVHPVTRTPILATAVVMILVYVLAAAFALERLAETTSRLTLIIFAFVNAALVQLKRSGRPAPTTAFVVPIGIPAAGFCLCVMLLLTELIRT
jgi:basic amino acid/polyamine antiporter, APA family